MTVPAKYTLTEAHFIIAELEAERDRVLGAYHRENDGRLAAEAERDEARGSAEILSSSLAATAESLQAAEARVTELEAERRAWEFAATAEGQHANEADARVLAAKAERDAAVRELAGMTYSGLVTRTLQRAEAAETERHELKNKLAVQQNWQTLYEREKARVTELEAALESVRKLTPGTHADAIARAALADKEGT